MMTMTSQTTGNSRNFSLPISFLNWSSTQIWRKMPIVDWGVLFTLHLNERADPLCSSNQPTVQLKSSKVSTRRLLGNKKLYFITFRISVRARGGGNGEGFTCTAPRWRLSLCLETESAANIYRRLLPAERDEDQRYLLFGCTVVDGNVARWRMSMLQKLNDRISHVRRFCVQFWHVRVDSHPQRVSSVEADLVHVPIGTRIEFLRLFRQQALLVWFLTRSGTSSWFQR